MEETQVEGFALDGIRDSISTSTEWKARSMSANSYKLMEEMVGNEYLSSYCT